ncbi:MAG TPA: hypothetical protein VGG33_01650 [Polyangia bacterium]
MGNRVASVASLSLASLAVVVLAGALAVGGACSSDEDQRANERPESPPPTATVDAGGGGADVGASAGCPSSPPRVGETCQRSTDVVDQICTYNLGSCMVDGLSYDNIEEYRCYEGTWHAWNAELNKCRMP